MEICNEEVVRKEQLDQEEIYNKSKENNNQHISSAHNLAKLNSKKFIQMPIEDNQIKFRYVSENTELNLGNCIIDKHLSEKNIMTHDKYSIDYQHPELKQNLDQLNTDKNLSFMNANDLIEETYDSLEVQFNDKRPSRKSAKEARKVWIDSHGIEDIAKLPNNTRRTKQKPFHPVKTHIQEDSNSEDQPLPIWAQKLTSVRFVNNAWIIGFVTSEKELQETIEGHCRNVVCDYIKSHPCTLKKRHIQRNQSSRLMWKNARVEFDGIPFSINSSDERRCIFAMNYKRKDKADCKSHKNDDILDIEYGPPYSSVQDESEQLQAVTGFKKNDAASGRQTRRYKDVLYTDCPAKILIKSIQKYPEYAVPLTSLMPEKKAQLSRLREDLQKKINITKEHLYHITLPLESCHNHPLTGRSRNIHPDIVSKVKEYVNQGYTTPKIIKGLLLSYIETVHQNDSISPQMHDRAYYPEVRDIANIIHTHCKKNGIIGKRKIISSVSGSDIRKRKRLKKKRVYLDGSTSLEEAVETFCKDEPGSLQVDGSPQPRSLQVDGSPQIKDSSRADVVEMPDVVSVGDMVRSQLDHLRTLTYSINQSPVLCDMYKSIQDLISHYGQHVVPKNHIAISEMNLCDVSDVPNMLDGTSEKINTSKHEVASKQYHSEFTNNGKSGLNVSRKVGNLATSTLECLAQAGAIHASMPSNMNVKSQAKSHNSNNNDNDNEIILKQAFLQSHQAIVSGQSVGYEVLLPNGVSNTTAAMPPHNMPGAGVGSHHNILCNMLPPVHSVPVSGAVLTHAVPSNGLMSSHNISRNGLASSPGSCSASYQSLAPVTQETSGSSVETSGGPVQLALQHYVYYVQEAQMPEGQSWAYPSNTA